MVSSQEKTIGYKMKQSVEVDSPLVDGIAELNSDSTALVEQGVLLTADPPKYIYSQAAETKIEMLSDATKDARARAERIANEGGRGIGGIARCGHGGFSDCAPA